MEIRLVKIALCCLGSLKVEAKILETKHVEEILPLIEKILGFWLTLTIVCSKELKLLVMLTGFMTNCTKEWKKA